MADNPLFEGHVTLDELVKKLRGAYSKYTIYRWVRQGIPHKKIRGKLWFPLQEVEVWLTRTT